MNETRVIRVKLHASQVSSSQSEQPPTCWTASLASWLFPGSTPGIFVLALETIWLQMTNNMHDTRWFEYRIVKRCTLADVVVVIGSTTILVFEVQWRTVCSIGAYGLKCNYQWFFDSPLDGVASFTFLVTQLPARVSIWTRRNWATHTKLPLLVCACKLDQTLVWLSPLLTRCGKSNFYFHFYFNASRLPTEQLGARRFGRYCGER